MEENIVRNYKYKVDKVERFFSIAILVIFMVSFKGVLGFYFFTAFTLIVFAYYYKFYRKKPDYLKINGEEITISQGLLFKLKTFNVSDLNRIEKLENKIEILLKQGEKLTLMKLLLSDQDFSEIFEVLTRKQSEN